MKINIEKISDYLKNIDVSKNYNWPIPFDKGHGKNIFSKLGTHPFIEIFSNIPFYFPIIQILSFSSISYSYFFNGSKF